jgi:hypothetical protein
VTMNQKKAVAMRNRQRELSKTPTADNDQRPAKKAARPDAPKREPRRRAAITLSPVSILRDR